MMEEKDKNKVSDTDAIAIIKEEYAKKLKEMEEKHKEDLKKQEEELNKKHADQIRALFLKGTPEQKQDTEDDEKSFYERVEEKMKQKLKLDK